MTQNFSLRARAASCSLVIASSSFGCGGADAPSGPPFKQAEYPSTVVSHTVGAGGGYNEAKLPGIVLGPPHGGGCCNSSSNVYSLGEGGEIVLEFAAPIVDGPGVDLLVFENPFRVGADPANVFAELGEVSVSDDGVNWQVFPCTATPVPPYGNCAGWHVVYATTASGVNADDPASAGGDPFDLADLGVKQARFVRIRDAHTKVPACCGTAGFDLAGVAAIHWAE